jgi:hypothetical protein
MDTYVIALTVGAPRASASNTHEIIKTFALINVLNLQICLVHRKSSRYRKL